MPVMRPVGDDEPLMIAWKAYRASEDAANSFRWLEKPEHREGSMWGAFMAGYLAAERATEAHPQPQEPQHG